MNYITFQKLDVLLTTYQDLLLYFIAKFNNVELTPIPFLYLVTLLVVGSVISFLSDFLYLNTKTLIKTYLFFQVPDFYLLT